MDNAAVLEVFENGWLAPCARWRLSSIVVRTKGVIKKYFSADDSLDALLFVTIRQSLVKLELAFSHGQGDVSNI